MAAVVAINPNPLALYKTGTVGLTGGPISTAVIFHFVTPGGGTADVTATTDGSGRASVPIVASTTGLATVTVLQHTITTLASMSTTVVGST